MSGWKRWGWIGMVLILLAALTIEAEAAELSHMQDEAVQLARDGSYEQSLALFRSLSEQGAADARFWQDYITVLCWAGDFEKASSIADARITSFDGVPLYVLKALEGAYEKTGRSEKMAEVVTEMAGQGDEGALLRQARRLMADGRIEEADQMYARLVTMGKLTPDRMYFERAMADLTRGDWTAGEEHMAAAHKAIKKELDAEVKIKDMDAEYAAALIRGGEYGAAASRLREYVEGGTASPRMAADYFVALRMAGRLDPREFERRYPDWDAFPLYGLQNIGDAYFRLKQYEKAEKVYDFILKKDGSLVYVRAARAYCLAMRKDEKSAVAEYEQALRDQPKMQEAVAADALSFIADQRISLAKTVFGLLGTTPEEKRAYQFRFARALAERGYYLASEEIYQSLGEYPELEWQVMVDQAVNKTRRGLYADAERMLNDVEQLGPGASAAAIAYAERARGHAGAWYNRSADYKGNDNYAYGAYTEGYLDKNSYFFGEFGREVYRDEEAMGRFDRNMLGVSWRYDRGRVDLARVLTDGDYDASSWRYYTEYDFNDLARLSLTAGRRAHMEAGAVEEGIDESYRALRWSQRLDGKNLVALDYEWADLSDGNHFDAYGLEWTHNTFQTLRRIDNVLFRYGWSGYGFASDFYEAPDRRVSAGLGFSRKWLLPENDRSWEWTVMGVWGHDNDEPTDFSPYTRLHFTQGLPGRQSISIGLEYGLRTNRLEDVGSLLHGYHQIDFNYYWEW